MGGSLVTIDFFHRVYSKQIVFQSRFIILFWNTIYSFLIWLPQPKGPP